MTNGLAVTGSMSRNYFNATGYQEILEERVSCWMTTRVGPKLIIFTCDIKISMPQQKSELCDVSDLSVDVNNTVEQPAHLVVLQETYIKQHKQSKSNDVVWYVGDSYIACMCFCMQCKHFIVVSGLVTMLCVHADHNIERWLKSETRYLLCWEISSGCSICP